MARTRGAALISETDVGRQRIRSLLEAHRCRVQEDDKGLFVREGFGWPIGLTLDPDAQIIKLWSHIEIVHLEHRNAGELAEWLNDTFKLVKFEMRPGGIFVVYETLYSGGLATEPFLRLIQRFTSIAIAAMSEMINCENDLCPVTTKQVPAHLH